MTPTPSAGSDTVTDACGASACDDGEDAAQPPASASLPRRGAWSASGPTVEIAWRASANRAVTDVPDGYDFTPWFALALRRIAGLAGVARGELSVAIVEDGEMATLHERYADAPGTTDVLTFDLDPPAGSVAGSDAGENAGPPTRSSVDGELVLCIDEAARQAGARGHGVAMELLLYAVHGLLHLLGEDDHQPDQAARMHQREDELLQQAGFAPVYATPVDVSDRAGLL